MTELRQLFVRLQSATTGLPFAPEGLRAAIVTDVLERESNLNDTVVAVLSEHYGTPWEPRGRRAHPNPNDDVLALRVPAVLLAAVDAGAAANGLSRQDETIRTLSEHYGLTFEAMRKRHGPRRATIAA
jgi:hypothetical protein